MDRNWRGIGTIPLSGFGLNENYQAFDATQRFDIGAIQTEESKICIAGQILQGLKKPYECPLLVPYVRLKHPWVRQWSLQKALVQPIIVTAGNPMTEPTFEPVNMQGPVCPVPHHHTDTIVIGHGSGGAMTRDLIHNIFQSHLGNAYLEQGNDAARIALANQGGEIAVSTDSHVVSPLFYPGGDIGRLAVCGTVNDVAMLGAKPSFLTAGFILEEGLPMKPWNE